MNDARLAGLVRSFARRVDAGRDEMLTGCEANARRVGAGRDGMLTGCEANARRVGAGRMIDG